MAMVWAYRLNPALVVRRDGAGAVLISLSPPAVRRLSPRLAALLTLCAEPRTAAALAAALPGAGTPDLQAALEVLADRHILLRELPSSASSSQGALADVPLVSIVIAVRNRAAELRTCLESVERLSYPRERLEVIVVDDASTDGTAAVAREFGVRYAVMPQPRGPAACRNAGAHLARGEILAFTDSDCVVSAGWLGDLVGAFGW